MSPSSLKERSVRVGRENNSGGTGLGLRAATKQVEIENDSDDCSSIEDLSVHRTPTEDDGCSLSDSEHEDSSAHYTPLEDSEDS